MKDEESQKLTPTYSATGASLKKADGSATASGPFTTKCGYKLWILSAIVLLAFWSMFTGTVTLKWSSGVLSSVSDESGFSLSDDLDILEVEEREKLVKRMWDVYVHSSTTRLPRFWQEAFEAAYEYLVSDTPAVRNDAVTEIAKMSFQSLNPDPVPAQSSSSVKIRKIMKQRKQRE